MAGEVGEGVGATVDEALWKAHEEATKHSGGELKRSQLMTIELSSGGFTGGREVRVRVHARDA